MGPDSAAKAAAAASDSNESDGLEAILFAKPAAKPGKTGAPAKDDAPDDDAGEGDDDDDEADPEHDGDDDAAPADDPDDPDNEDLAQGDDDDDDPDGDDDAEAGAGDDDAADPDAKLDKADTAARAKFTPAQQAQFDKAIGKKVASLKAERALREAAEKRAEALEAAGTGTGAAAYSPEDPLGNVETMADLDASVANTRSWRQWLRLHPEGGTRGEGDKAQEVTADQARTWLLYCEDVLADHAPARREYLKQREAAEADAVKTHPWLKTKTHPGTVEIDAQLKKHPQLRGVPGIRALLADAYVGRAARKAKAAAPAAGADGKPKVPKAPPNPGAGGQRAPKVTSRKPAAKATERLETEGEDRGNAALRDLLFTGED